MKETHSIQVHMTLTQEQYEWFMAKGFFNHNFKKAAFIQQAFALAHRDYPMGTSNLQHGGKRNAKWLLLRRKNYEKITKVICKRGQWRNKVATDDDNDEVKRSKAWLIMGEFDSEEEAKKYQYAYKLYVERDEKK